MNDSEKLLPFFSQLYQETESIEACENNVRKAVAAVAELLHVGKVEIMLNAPRTNLRPEGEHRTLALFYSDNVSKEHIHEMIFSLPDKGKITMLIYPVTSDGFTVDEENVLGVISQAIYTQFSRVIMKGLLTQVVNTDTDTGAYTMDYLVECTAKLMAQHKVDRYGAVFFNIHGFKYVNKVFSYSEGDAILKTYTQRVMCLLEPDEILTRLGGDNYVMLVKLDRMNELIKQVADIRITYQNEHREKNFVFGITAGYSGLAGITEPRDIMKRVSVAFAAARKRGAGNIVEYTEEVQREVMENQAVLSNFVYALENHEFVVYYQPKVNIQEKTMYGAEALVRWVRNGRLVPPVQFIPQLEQEGSIIALDYYVLEEVCKWLRKRIDGGLKPVCISVNFSRRHLEEDDLAKHIVAVIDKYNIDHSYIEIELTESEDFQNFEVMTELVNDLKECGIGTSMDDFGTGFSSLNMIKKVDLHVIKIDKSFIPLETEYMGKEKDLIMFNHIVKMVKELGKKTVAEGVESEKQLDYLRDVGCDIVQGYVFDKPLTEEEFEKRLETGY